MSRMDEIRKKAIKRIEMYKLADKTVLKTTLSDYHFCASFTDGTFIEVVAVIGFDDKPELVFGSSIDEYSAFVLGLLTKEEYEQVKDELVRNKAKETEAREKVTLKELLDKHGVPDDYKPQEK